LPANPCYFGILAHFDKARKALWETPEFLAIIRSMHTLHPKAVRRRILEILYQRYLSDPLEMLAPEDFLADEAITRENLIPNIHYLNDRKLVELMIGYSPPLFAAARIRAEGIDLVENPFEFDWRFPPAIEAGEGHSWELPALIERLVEEGDFAPLDGEERRALLRDVQYLRDEVARPPHRWRRHVIATVLDWIEAPLKDEVEEILPSAKRIRQVIDDAEAP